MAPYLSGSGPSNSVVYIDATRSRYHTIKNTNPIVSFIILNKVMSSLEIDLTTRKYAKNLIHETMSTRTT